MGYPTGLLHNTRLDRWHPIPFRRAPMPGNSDGDSAHKRYKSIGHHTKGFTTKEEAVAHIAAETAFEYHAGYEWKWDGEGIPALQACFPDTPSHTHIEEAAKQLGFAALDPPGTVGA